MTGNTDLTGKRLLMLGAIGGMNYAVQAARKMGVYTIVTDYYPDSQAKEIGDKCYDVSTTDLEALSRIIEQERVDGIFTGFSDVNIRIASILCKKYGFPCYTTEDLLLEVQNKARFKELCTQAGVPVPHTYALEELRNTTDDNWPGPLMVKPVDSYASKGISVCRNREELESAVRYALSFSRSKRLTIEDYLDGDEVMVHYVMMNGRFKLTSIFKRRIAARFSSLEKPIAPILISNECEYYDQIRRLEPALSRMYHNMGLKNAVGFLQGIAGSRGVHFFEMALRFGGNVSELFNMACGQTDIIAEFIRYSLTGTMDSRSFERITPDFGKYCCNYTVFLREGRVCRIDGEDRIRQLPQVVDIQRYCTVGDRICKDQEDTYKAVAYRFVMVTENRQEARKLQKQILDLLEIRDEQGERMLKQYPDLYA